MPANTWIPGPQFGSAVSRFLASVFLTVVSATGCADGIENKQEKRPVEEIYFHYVDLIRQQASLTTLAEHWDASNRKLIFEASDGKGGLLPPERFESVLRYPLMFREVPPDPVFIEAGDGQKCMTLRGYTPEGDPLIVDILFTDAENSWLKSEFFITSASDGQKLPEHQPCSL